MSFHEGANEIWIQPQIVSKFTLEARIEHCLETACYYENIGGDKYYQNEWLNCALEWEERLRALEEDK